MINVYFFEIVAKNIYLVVRTLKPRNMQQDIAKVNYFEILENILLEKKISYERAVPCMVCLTKTISTPPSDVLAHEHKQKESLFDTI